MFNKFPQIFCICKFYSIDKRIYTFINLLLFSIQSLFSQSNIEIHTAKKIYVADTQFNSIQSIAIYHGNIIFTGNLDDARIAYPKASIINHKGYLYPGFIDAHCHFLAYCRGTKELNLYDITSPEKVGKMAKKFAKKNKREWVIGRGWDQNLWPTKEFPSKSILDKYVPKKPVCLSRVDGHAIWVN